MQRKQSRRRSVTWKSQISQDIWTTEQLSSAWDLVRKYNLKSMNLATMMKKSPEQVLTRAVRGMLPKTKLGNVMIKKLKVFAGPEHTHTAQQPKILEI